MIVLDVIGKCDPSLRAAMAVHYSRPKGFVGRSIIYRVSFGGTTYGFTVGGSATMHLAGRGDFFGGNTPPLNNLVNNTFFHVEPGEGGYPIRNFVPKVIAAFRDRVATDWRDKYGDPVEGFETLVEPPRTGEAYRRDGWLHVGTTEGFTCKREAGKGTDAWSGRRVWNTTDLRPKLVLCRKVV